MHNRHSIDDPQEDLRRNRTTQQDADLFPNGEVQSPQPVWMPTSDVSRASESALEQKYQLRSTVDSVL
jgi:hypothetical protein